MKKTVIAILTLILLMPGVSAFAQGKYGADSAECIKYLSYYKEYFKQKNYEDATRNWRQAYAVCPPTASQNMLIDGTNLVRKLIQANKKNPIYVGQLVDTLLTLHDLRAEYYPKYAVTALNNKGKDMAMFLKDDSQRLHDAYSEIIEANGTQTAATVFLFDLQAVIDLYRSGSCGAEDVINVYQNNLSLLENLVTKTDAEEDQRLKVKSDLESLFITSRVASCEDLVALFTPKFEADPENLYLASNIVSTLSSAEDCTGNDLFLNAVLTVNKLNPTATNSYLLYKLYSSRADNKNAQVFLEKTIALSEGEEADKHNLELAKHCLASGYTTKAYSVASKLLSSPAYAGQAYMLIGTIWGSSSCGNGEIDGVANFWVAVDYMNKAKATDPTLAEEANRFISIYSKRYPTVEDAFFSNIKDGEKYEVSCAGMTATTTVRTQAN